MCLVLHMKTVKLNKDDMIPFSEDIKKSQSKCMDNRLSESADRTNPVQLKEEGRSVKLALKPMFQKTASAPPNV